MSELYRSVLQDYSVQQRVGNLYTPNPQREYVARYFDGGFPSLSPPDRDIGLVDQWVAKSIGWSNASPNNFLGRKRGISSYVLEDAATRGYVEDYTNDIGTIFGFGTSFEATFDEQENFEPFDVWDRMTPSMKTQLSGVGFTRESVENIKSPDQYNYVRNVFETAAEAESMVLHGMETAGIFQRGVSSVLGFLSFTADDPLSALAVLVPGGLMMGGRIATKVDDAARAITIAAGGERLLDPLVDGYRLSEAIGKDGFVAINSLAAKKAVHARLLMASELGVLGVTHDVLTQKAELDSLYEMFSDPYYEDAKVHFPRTAVAGSIGFGLGMILGRFKETANLGRFRNAVAEVFALAPDDPRRLAVLNPQRASQIARNEVSLDKLLDTAGIDTDSFIRIYGDDRFIRSAAWSPENMKKAGIEGTDMGQMVRDRASQTELEDWLKASMKEGGSVTFVTQFAKARNRAEEATDALPALLTRREELKLGVRETPKQGVRGLAQEEAEELTFLTDQIMHAEKDLYKFRRDYDLQRVTSRGLEFEEVSTLREGPGRGITVAEANFTRVINESEQVIDPGTTKLAFTRIRRIKDAPEASVTHELQHVDIERNLDLELPSVMTKNQETKLRKGLDSLIDKNFSLTRGTGTAHILSDRAEMARFSLQVFRDGSPAEKAALKEILPPRLRQLFDKMNTSDHVGHQTYISQMKVRQAEIQGLAKKVTGRPTGREKALQALLAVQNEIRAIRRKGSRAEMAMKRIEKNLFRDPSAPVKTVDPKHGVPRLRDGTFDVDGAANVATVHRQDVLKDSDFRLQRQALLTQAFTEESILGARAGAVGRTIREGAEFIGTAGQTKAVTQTTNKEVARFIAAVDNTWNTRNLTDTPTEAGKYVKSLRQHFDDASVSTHQHKQAIYRIQREHNLTDAQLGDYHYWAMRKMSNESVVESYDNAILSKLVAQHEKHYEFWANKGLETGHLRSTLKGFIPHTYNNARLLKEGERFKDVYSQLMAKSWLNDSSELHRLTLRKMGLMDIDESGKFVWTELASELGENRTPKTMGELNDTMKSAYEESFLITMSDEASDIIHKNADPTALARDEGFRRAFRADRTGSKGAQKIDNSIYLDETMRDFAVTDPYVMASGYLQTAYKTGRQQLMNEYSGVTGLSWDQFQATVRKLAQRAEPDENAVVTAQRELQMLFDTEAAFFQQFRSYQPADAAIDTLADLTIGFIKNAFGPFFGIASLGESAAVSTLLGHGPRQFAERVIGLFNAAGSKAHRERMLEAFAGGVDASRASSRFIYDINSASTNPFSISGAFGKSMQNIADAYEGNTLQAVSQRSTSETHPMRALKQAWVESGNASIRGGGTRLMAEINHTAARKAVAMEFGDVWKNVRKFKTALNDESFSSLPRNSLERVRAIRRIARQTLGGDGIIVAQDLQRFRILDDDILLSVDEMVEAGYKVLPETKAFKVTMLDPDEMRIASLTNPDKAQAARWAEAADRFTKMFDRRMGDASLRPGPFDVPLSGGSQTGYGKMNVALTTFLRSLQRSVVQKTADTDVKNFVTMLSTVATFETAYMIMKRMSRGDTPEDIMNDMENDPVGFMANALGRIPFLGPPQTLLMDTLLDTFGLANRRISTGGAGYGTLSQMLNAVRNPTDQRSYELFSRAILPFNTVPARFILSNTVFDDE